jgi:ribonuclease T1
MRHLLLACWLLCLALLAPGCTQAEQQASAELPWIAQQQLPAEARQTLQLIDAGGPFAFARDGIVFGNFERLLPRQRRGYYHEYTVPTPGVKQRGARRIVTGEAGERYYTADHYRSFRRIKP